jgi:hypothetical protein
MGLKVHINYTCSRFSSIAIKLLAAGFFAMIRVLPDNVMMCPLRYGRIIVAQVLSGAAPNITIAFGFFGWAFLQVAQQVWLITRLSKLANHSTVWAVRTDC